MNFRGIESGPRLFNYVNHFFTSPLSKMPIPPKMKAVLLSPPGASSPEYCQAQITDIETPKIEKDDDILVNLHAAALNHRDRWYH